LPTPLVVKNGSKALAITSGVMPMPVLAGLDAAAAVSVVEVAIGGLNSDAAALGHTQTSLLTQTPCQSTAYPRRALQVRVFHRALQDGGYKLRGNPVVGSDPA
jgi:hypothetical protein